VDEITVRDLYGRWEKVRRFTRSWRLERARLEPFVRLAGDRPAIEITPEAWSDLRAIRMYEASPRTGRRVSAATLDTELLRAKQMYAWAAVAGVLPSNPLATAHGAGARTARETWLTWGQVETLLPESGRLAPFAEGQADHVGAAGFGGGEGERATASPDEVGGVRADREETAAGRRRDTIKHEQTPGGTRLGRLPAR